MLIFGVELLTFILLLKEYLICFGLVGSYSSLINNLPVDEKPHKNCQVSHHFKSVTWWGKQCFTSLVGKKESVLLKPSKPLRSCRRTGPGLEKDFLPGGCGETAILGAETDQRQHSPSVNSG